MKIASATKSETLKARMGLGGPALNRIPGPPPLVPDHTMMRCIGQGSYGEVWLAQNAVGTWRAVKVVYRQNFNDARPYEREFAGIQRYEPISRSNEGLIDVLQIGRNDNDGYFYYVMELADAADSVPSYAHLSDTGIEAQAAAQEAPGPRAFAPEEYVPKTLSRIIQQRGRLSYEECITLGLNLNLALGHLHRQGLIHRDVKPSNIIFINGVPKLTDIGLVTDLAGAQSFVGTEGFIPPEGPNSPQADLYALGKVLYEASMGKDRNEFPEPFTALGLDDDSRALMELNAVLVKACAPDPKDRYQRAEEMNADLALLHNGESVRNKHALERRLKRMTRIGIVTVAMIVLGVVPYSLAVREKRLAIASARNESEQRERAVKEAAKSKEVAQFLKDMLKGAEPSFALGRDTTMLREILDQTAQRIGRDLKNQPNVEAELRSTLGEVYRELGQYKEAEEMLRPALEIRLHNPEEKDEVVAQTLCDLSPALWHQGKWAEAEALQRQALARRIQFAGESSLPVAESLQDLACIANGKAKMSEAEALFRKALEIRRAILGPEHALVAQSLSGVANMLNARGQWAAAEGMFREILAMNSKRLGRHDPSYAVALNSLVQSLLPQGKLAEAELDAREGLAIQKELLGPDHPLVADSLTRLARVLHRPGRLSEAKTCLKEALSIWSRHLNNQNSGAGETLSALFDILLSEGNRAEAEMILQQVLSPAALGDNPNQSLLLACGRYHARTGQWAQAAADFSKLIQLAPENHEAYHALSAVYVRNGDSKGYAQLCEQVRALFAVTSDPSIADRMAKDCLILPNHGPLGVETKLADLAVSFDPASTANPWFHFCKGLAQFRLGDYNAAEHWMRKVLSRLKDGSTRDVEAYFVLAMAEHRLGKPLDARKAWCDGVQLAARRLAPANSEDIGDGWIDWVFANALKREAEAMLSAEGDTSGC